MPKPCLLVALYIHTLLPHEERYYELSLTAALLLLRYLADSR